MKRSSYIWIPESEIYKGHIGRCGHGLGYVVADLNWETKYKIQVKKTCLELKKGSNRYRHESHFLKNSDSLFQTEIVINFSRKNNSWTPRNPQYSIFQKLETLVVEVGCLWGLWYRMTRLVEQLSYFRCSGCTRRIHETSQYNFCQESALYYFHVLPGFWVFFNSLIISMYTPCSKDIVWTKTWVYSDTDRKIDSKHDFYLWEELEKAVCWCIW